MTERMDWKNTLCATDNFRYKLIRYKEKVYAVDWLPHWYSVLAGIFICFFKKKAYFLSAGVLPDSLFVSIEVMKEEEKIQSDLKGK